jgi:hypothetical protein
LLDGFVGRDLPISPAIGTVLFIPFIAEQSASAE